MNSTTDTVAPNNTAIVIAPQPEVIQAETTVGAIPYKTQDSSIEAQALASYGYIAVLFVVVTLVMVLAKKYLVAKGNIPKRFGQHINVLDRKVVSTKTTIFLLELDRSKVLLIENVQQTTAVCIDTENASGSNTHTGPIADAVKLSDS